MLEKSPTGIIHTISIWAGDFIQKYAQILEAEREARQRVSVDPDQVRRRELLEQIQNQQIRLGKAYDPSIRRQLVYGESNLPPPS